MIYYHGTSYKSLSGVLERGLSPGEALSHEYGRKVSFFTDDPVDALQFGPIVLEINIPSGYIRFHEDFGFISNKKIPPQFISVYAKVPESPHIAWAFGGELDLETGKRLLEEGKEH